MQEITIIRHGRLQGAAGFYGATNYPLSDEGRQQARQAGERFRGQSFDRVFCSPLDRAVETMELFCVQSGLDCSRAVRDDRLRETDFGRAEGKSYEQVRELFPEYARELASQNWLNAQPPGGETPMEFMGRVKRFLDEYSGDEGKTVIFCHGGVIRAAICVLLGDRPHYEGFMQYFTDYCRATVIEVRDGYGVMKGFNL